MSLQNLQTGREARDAYAEGVDAYHLGMSETDNPFPEGSDDHLSWNDGWNEAAEWEEQADEEGWI